MSLKRLSRLLLRCLRPRSQSFACRCQVPACGRGLRGRAQLVDYFDRQIPLRRERGGEDLFSHLCRATWDDGSLLSTIDIVNHMIFLMLAAHDTLTSSFTSLVYRLAVHPDWQENTRRAERARHRRKRAIAVRSPRRSPDRGNGL